MFSSSVVLYRDTGETWLLWMLYVFLLWGSRRWLQWKKEIELLSDLTYYVLTTLSGERRVSTRPLMSCLWPARVFHGSVFLFRISDSGWGVCQHHTGGPQQEEDPLERTQNSARPLPRVRAVRSGQDVHLYRERAGAGGGARDERNLEPGVTPQVLDRQSAGDVDWSSEKVFAPAGVCPAAGNRSLLPSSCGSLLHHWKLLSHQ